jgi:hypothetical protein
MVTDPPTNPSRPCEEARRLRRDRARAALAAPRNQSRQLAIVAASSSFKNGLDREGAILDSKPKARLMRTTLSIVLNAGTAFPNGSALALPTLDIALPLAYHAGMGPPTSRYGATYEGGWTVDSKGTSEVYREAGSAERGNDSGC